MTQPSESCHEMSGNDIMLTALFAIAKTGTFPHVNSLHVISWSLLFSLYSQHLPAPSRLVRVSWEPGSGLSEGQCCSLISLFSGSVAS